MTFAVTIEGGCNPILQQPIRARFKKELAEVAIGSNGRFSDYFTHSRDIIGSFPPKVELIACQYPDLPHNVHTNPELKYDFPDLEAELSFEFKLKYTPSSSISQVTHFVSVFMGNFEQLIGVKEVLIKPYVPITILPGQTVRDVIDPYGNARFFQINGDLDLPFNTAPTPVIPGDYLYEVSSGSSSGITGYNFSGYNFLMGAGNKIHINTDVKMKFIEGNIAGCETMWEGIELEEGASIECHSSTLKDAQFAVRLKGSGIASIRESTFENNNFGFQALKPINSSSPIIVMSGNTFVSTGTLKSFYSGQSPLPFGAKGYAGIYVDRIPALNISRSGDSDNLFENLHNGIIAYNSNVRLSHSFFEDITKVSGAPNLPGTFNSPGKAIFSKGGTLTVNGTGILTANPANFNNCHTGIESQNGTLAVSNSKMVAVDHGVVSNVSVNKNVNIIGNDIQAKDRGIAVSHQQALFNGSTVSNNIVRMVGNTQGVGIKTGGSDNFPQHEGLINLNTVIVTDGAAAIDIGASRNLKVSQNTTTLNSGSTSYGIGIAGGDLNTINCNTANGVAEKGIYGLMAGRSNFLCNNTTGTGLGIHFDGVFVGKGNIKVAGNTMNSHAGGGLLMGGDAVIGEQVHQGNKWTGGGFTLAQHLGGVSVALKSLFTVDADEDADFLPDVVLPLDWFIDASSPSTSFQCIPGGTACPLIPFASDYVREKEIAKGQLTDLTHQSTQLWTAQRRLYEKLSEEGNPYPGDSDISAFLSSSQINGLSGFAELQMDIRQLFHSDSIVRSNLFISENHIAQQLTQLASWETQLDTADIDQQDSIYLTTQRHYVQQNLISIQAFRDSMYENMLTTRTTAANALLTQNDGLSGSGGIRFTEKVVNAIFLEMIAMDSVELSSTQRTTLLDIASQCPLSGGEAVLRARDLLAATPEGPFFYDDSINCTGARPVRDRVVPLQNTDLVQLRPNPATERITIGFAFNDASETHHLLLINAVGQLVGDFQLSGLEGEMNVSIAHLPTGVYYYTVTGSYAPGTSGKLFINR
jgi:hypothetical protein